MITIIKRFRKLIEAGGLDFVRQANKGADVYRNARTGRLMRYIHDPEEDARQQNPNLQGKVEQKDSPVYGFFRLLSTTTPSFTYFNVKLGDTQGGIVLTEMHTNMTEAGKLPLPDKLFVQCISLYVATQIVADLFSVLNRTIFEFFASQKPYWRAPFHALAAGFGPYGATTATASSILNNGLPTDTSKRILKKPIDMEPGESFYGKVSIYGAASFAAGAISTLDATNPPDTWCYLEGIRDSGL